nr:MAG TPA: hypothetical protein [Caudoviricetes sp.]
MVGNRIKKRARSFQTAPVGMIEYFIEAIFFMPGAIVPVVRLRCSG